MSENIVGSAFVAIEPDLDFASLGAQIKAAMAGKDQKVKIKPELDSNVAKLAGERAGKDLVDGIGRGAGGGSGGGDRIGRSFGDGFSRSFSNSITPAERRLNSFGGNVSFFNVIAAGVAGLASQFVALADAIAPAVGIIAGIPAVAGAATASLGTLLTGFLGIGNALKTAVKASAAGGVGGGGETASAALAKQQAIKSATEAVAKANRDVVEAQKNVISSSKAVDAAQRGVEQAYKDVAAAGRSLIAAQKGVEAAQRAVVAAQRGVQDANDQVVTSTRNVADSQRAAIAAQKALTTAREEAKAALEDYVLQLKEAQANEESADIALQEARDRLQKLEQQGAATTKASLLALARARKDVTQAELDRLQKLEVTTTTSAATALELRRAQNDVTQAELHYQEAVKNTADVAKKKADADAKGIDNADNVVAAQDAVVQAAINQDEANKSLAKSLQAVDDAAQGVKDAQDNVADAIQRVSDAYDGVNDAAQKVVDAQDAVASANDNVAKSQQDVLDAQEAVIDANTRLKEAQLAAAEGAAKVGAAQTAAAQAMAALSPKAQEVVRAILGLRGTWDDLRHSVQDKMFDGIASEITTLAAVLLPTLKTGMGLVAESFNGLFKAGGEAAKSPIFQAALATTFSTTSAAISRMSEAIGPLIIGLANLAAAGSPILLQFNDFIARGLETAGAFLSTTEGAKKMQDVMSSAAHVISELFGILVNLGKITIDIFAAGAQTNYLENLKKITGQFDTFLKSAEGKKDLATIFQTLQTLSASLLLVLPYVARAIVDVLTAFNSLPEPVQKVIGAFIVLSPLLGPITSGLGGILSIARLLGPALAAIVSPVGLAVIALAAIGIGATLAYQHIQGFHDGVNAAMRGLKGAVGEVIDFVRDKFNEIAKFSKEIWPQVEEAVTHVANIIQRIWHDVGDDILSAVDRAWNGIKGVIDGALEIIMGVITTALAVINGDWGKAWDGIKEILGGVWDVMFAIVTTALGLIQSALGAAFSAIADLFKKVWGDIKDALKSVWDGIKGIFDDGVSFISDVPGRISKALDKMWDFIKDQWSDVRDSIKTIGDDAVTFITGIPDRIFRGLDKMWNFVKDQLSDVRDKVKTIGDDVVTYFGGLPERMGKALAGLWDGIKDSFKAAINQVIDWWDGLNFTVPKTHVIGTNIDIGGFGIGTPHINRLAEGGLLQGLAVVGEEGPEIVSSRSLSRVNTNKDFVASLITALKAAGIGGGEGAGKHYNLSLNTNRSESDVATQFGWMELMGLGAA